MTIDCVDGCIVGIKFVSGSVEAACGLGLADAVVDLVETGTTMKVKLIFAASYLLVFLPFTSAASTCRLLD